MKQINASKIVKASWEDMLKFVRRIKVEFASEEHVVLKGVTGVVPNGLPIAVAVSSYLKAPYISSIPMFAEEYRCDSRSALLILDGITDTGETLQKVWKNLTPFQIQTYFMTWFCRPPFNGKIGYQNWIAKTPQIEKKGEAPLPLIWSHKSAKGRFIVFPWEDADVRENASNSSIN